MASPGRRILGDLMRPHAPSLALLLVGSFVGSLVEAFFLVGMTGIAMGIATGTDTVSLGATTDGVLPPLSINAWLVLGVVLLGMRLLLATGNAWLEGRTTAAILTRQRRRVTWGYLDADWATQQQEASGKLQGVIGFASSTNAVVNNVLGIATAGLSLTAFIAASLLVDVASTGVVALGLVLLGSAMIPLRRWIRRRAQIRARSSLAFTESIGELGSMGLEMHSFGVRERFKQAVDRLSTRDARHGRAVDTLSLVVSPIYVSMAYGAALAGVALAQGVSNLDATVLGAVMLLMLRSLSYGQQVQTQSVSLASNWPRLEQVDANVRRYEANRASGGEAVPPTEMPLALEHVSYAYTPDRTALKDVSLEVRRGDSIGIVGPSGSGKSTLIQLILGLRNPTAGVVAVAGVDLREVDRSWWTSHMALVPQDPVLFTGTVVENIRFFRDGISDEDVERSARQANVLDEILALPQGFNTHLGQGGSQLSGGQRQRLSIARALAGSPRILVMDEPTSALDGRSEALVKEALAALTGEVTIIMIAHRVSTLDQCTRILVVEDGRITTDAPAAEALASSAYYRRMRGLGGDLAASPSLQGEATHG